MTDSTAVALACAALNKRASDVRMALVPGLADDLRLIGEALRSLEFGQRSLATSVLAKHFAYEIPKREYNHLVELARELEDPSCPQKTNQ
jgi:hypothetical protein